MSNFVHTVEMVHPLCIKNFTSGDICKVLRRLTFFCTFDKVIVSAHGVSCIWMPARVADAQPAAWRPDAVAGDGDAEKRVPACIIGLRKPTILCREFEKTVAGPWYEFTFCLFRVLIDLVENLDLAAEPGGTAN